MSNGDIEQDSREGGCACGAVRYRLDGEPLFVHACHCKDCQRLSGSAFGVTMIVTADEFRVLRGEPASGEIRADSGTLKQAYWCPGCGSYLWGRSGGRPGCVSIRPGTLDDSDWFTPGAHIWTRSKQRWVELPADVPAFDKTYDQNEMWPAKSLRRLAELSQS